MYTQRFSGCRLHFFGEHASLHSKPTYNSHAYKIVPSAKHQRFHGMLSDIKQSYYEQFVISWMLLSGGGVKGITVSGEAWPLKVTRGFGERWTSPSFRGWSWTTFKICQGQKRRWVRHLSSQRSSASETPEPRHRNGLKYAVSGLILSVTRPMLRK